MDSSLSSRPQTQRLPRDVQGWASLFDVATLPVLADTAADIEALRANEDAVDAHRLAEVLAADPLMTLKVMSRVGVLRRGRDNGEPETLTAALVMMGISPFFRHFGTQPTVEQHLAELEACIPDPGRSRLLALWRVAGWLTGAVPALFGPRAVYATIDAVETFVDRHYAAQLELIDRLQASPAPGCCS